MPTNSFTPLKTWDATSCALDIDAHAIPANAKKSEGEHFHHDIAYATILNPGVELNAVDDEGVDNREWTPLQEWGNLSERNRRMLDILEDHRYGMFMDTYGPTI